MGALVESQAKDAGAYWRKLKQRLVEEGADQVVTDCHDLKLPDGKSYRTDCANIETMFRVIQSIPSKKAEPFKQWLAKVGFERVRETAEPSRMARRMVQAYRDLGYSRYCHSSPRDGFVTRRSVRQNLPPSSSRLDVPGWMRSMPW